MLICRTDNIGDVILTLPLAIRAASVFGRASVYLYVKESVAPLLEGVGPGIKVVARKQNAPDKEVFRSLSPDIAIFALPEFGTALAAFRLGTKIRAGTAYRWYSFLYNLKVREHRKFADKHESVYNLNLLSAITGNDENNGIPERLLHSGTEELLKFRDKLQALGIRTGDKYVVIHPGSRGSARDVSMEQIREFAGRLLVLCPSHRLVFTGTHSECGRVSEAIPAEQGERTVNLCGKLELRELMMLIDGSELFISNSTGPAHIAGALNRNILAFYPNSVPVNATRWKPLGRNVTVMSPHGSDDMSLISMEEAAVKAAQIIKNENKPLNH